MMKRYFILILVILATLTSIAQPAGYVPGTFVTWRYNNGVNGAKDHGFFKSDGFDAAPDSLKRVVIHGEGDGEVDSNGLVVQSPGKLLNDLGTNWNGKVTRPDGKTVHYMVFTVYNHSGNWLDPYVGDLNYFFANTTNLPDTSLHQCYILTGFSGGPYRMWGSILNGSFARANIFGFTGMVSPTTFAPSVIDITIPSTGKYNLISRNNNDANGGTPAVASTDYFADLAPVKKQFITFPTGGHSADNFFSIGGTDSSTNRWYLWAMAIPPSMEVSGPTGTPSSNLLNLTGDNVADLTLVDGKDGSRLFDGNLNTSIDKDGIYASDILIPDDYYIIFDDSLRHNLKIEYYDVIGISDNIELTLIKERSNADNIDLSIDSLYSCIIPTNNYLSWQTLSGYGIENYDSIRAIRLRVKDATAYTTITEMRISGDAQGPVKSRYAATVHPNPDAGTKGYGIGQLNDKNMGPISELAEAVRVIQPIVQIKKAGEKYTPLTQTSLVFDNGGIPYDSWNRRLFDTSKAKNMEITMAMTGGSMLNIPDADAGTFNYGTWTEPTFNASRAYIVPGSDSLQLDQWKGLGHVFAGLTYLYTTHSTVAPGAYNIEGGLSTRSQGGITEFSNFNEFQKTWKGRAGRLRALPYYASQQVVYDSVKAINPNAKVFIGAFTSPNARYMSALNWAHYMYTRNKRPFPADGWNFNCYMSSQYGGQSVNSSDVGITPERYRIDSVLAEWKRINDKFFGGLPTHWTEHGFSTSTSEPFDVPIIAGKPQKYTVADWYARSEFEAEAAGNALQKMFFYWYTSDGSSNFASMFADSMKFDGPGGSYSGYDRTPVGFYMQQRLKINQGYPWRSSKLINGDSTGISVSVKQHSTLNKRLYQLKRGTMTGATGSYNLNLGANAVSAKMIEWSYTSADTTESTLTISFNSVTLPVTEKKVYVEVTYVDQPIQNPKYKVKIKYQ